MGETAGQISSVTAATHYRLGFVMRQRLVVGLKLMRRQYLTVTRPARAMGSGVSIASLRLL